MCAGYMCTYEPRYIREHDTQHRMVQYMGARRYRQQPDERRLVCRATRGNPPALTRIYHTSGNDVWPIWRSWRGPLANYLHA
jgi:hypothetical protein